MTTTVPIDVATVQDIPAIQRVARWSFHAAYDDLLGEQLVDAILEDWYATERLREQVTAPESVFLVASRGGRIRGFIDVDPHETSDAYFLSRLYVEPSLWGNGIGSQLLDAALHELPTGSQWIELTALDGNDRAIAFYERRGFEYVRSQMTTLGPIEVEEHVFRKSL